MTHAIMFTHTYREDDDPTNPHRKPQNEVEIEAVASGWEPCNGLALKGRQYIDCNGWINPITESCGSLAPFRNRIEFRTLLLQHRPVKLAVSGQIPPILDCSCGNHIDRDKVTIVHASDPTAKKAWADHVIGVILDAGLKLERR